MSVYVYEWAIKYVYSICVYFNQIVELTRHFSLLHKFHRLFKRKWKLNPMKYNALCRRVPETVRAAGRVDAYLIGSDKLMSKSLCAGQRIQRNI